MSSPARNGPCPCGSGRKYKHCCLLKPSPAARLQLALRHAEAARAPLHAFAAEPGFQALLTAAWFRFTEGRGLNEGSQSETERVRFLDWFQLIHRLPSGETVLECFLRERGARLPADHRAILEGWRQCMPGIYQVLELQPTGVRLMDVFRNQEVEIQSTVVQEAAIRWDLILGNVIDTEGVATLSGAIVTLGPMALPSLRRFAQRELRSYRRKVPRASWDEFLRARFERFNVFLDQQTPPDLVTPEGDQICFATARYDVTDPRQLAARIAAHPHIEATEPDSDEPDVRTYTWFERMDRPRDSAPSLPGFLPESRRSLGWIEWRGRSLSLECLTPERLERGKAVLAELGDGLRHRADSLQSLHQALAERREEKPVERTIPAEIEANLVGKLYEDHYATWPDEPLPALSGKTPREAIGAAPGRANVEELIRSFENAAERQRREGRPAYDFSKLRAALGLGESAAPTSRSTADATERARPSSARRSPTSKGRGVGGQGRAEALPPTPGPGALGPEQPPELQETVDDAADAAWAFVNALDEYDESAVRPLLLPGRLADALVDTFGVDALIGVSGWAEPYPEVRSTGVLTGGENVVEVEFEHCGAEDDEPAFPFTVSLQRYRKRWLVERVLPTYAGQAVDLDTLPSDLAELLLGAMTIPPLPTAARDQVEAILLQSLPGHALNVLEQATALRIWRDFGRRFSRTATLSPGHEQVWAAAVEYVVRVLESVEGSQAAVGEAYGTSAGTLARYAKQIETVLALQHNDPRYVIVPDRAAQALAAVARAVGARRRMPFGAGRGKSFWG